MGAIVEFSTKYQLNPDQYFHDGVKKRAIVLHHTISSSVESVFEWWQNDMYPDGEPRRVGTAFVIDKAGTVFQLFPPDLWCHHLGCKHPGNRAANMESIGIELVNEGGLIPRGQKWYWFSGRAEYNGDIFHCMTNQHVLPWRGFLAFAAYPAAQIESCVDLVSQLCATFGIKRTVPADPLAYDIETLNFHGIFTHCNVRQDKTDVHAGFPWQSFSTGIKNTP